MILFNGQLVPEAEARISYLDRGYYFGDGIYEVFRVYHGQIYAQKPHLKRLMRSLQEIAISINDSEKQLIHYIQELVQANQLQHGIVYLQFTRGVAPRSHDFPSSCTPVMMGFTKEIPRPEKNKQEGITAMTDPDIRWLRCDIKSLNLLPNTLGKQKAKEQGVQEVIFHRDGIVTECSSSNIMIVKDGQLYTHPANHLILHGVTRSILLDLASNLNLNIHEQAFNVETLLQADEVFICGTVAEVTPVVRIDGQQIADGKPGPITRKLQQAYDATLPQSH